MRTSYIMINSNSNTIVGKVSIILSEKKKKKLRFRKNCFFVYHLYVIEFYECIGLIFNPIVKIS